MKTFNSQFRVESSHIDRGNHANWRAQLAVAEEIHFNVRERHYDLGLELLRQNHNLFLVIQKQSAIYLRQLLLGDVVDVSTTISIVRPTVLRFDFMFLKDKQIATEISWLMSFVSADAGKPRKSPEWVTVAIGPGEPSICMQI